MPQKTVRLPSACRSNAMGWHPCQSATSSTKEVAETAGFSKSAAFVPEGHDKTTELERTFPPPCYGSFFLGKAGRRNPALNGHSKATAS